MYGEFDFGFARFLAKLKDKLSLLQKVPRIKKPDRKTSTDFTEEHSD